MLFELAEDDPGATVEAAAEPDEETREVRPRDLDEEETLHPEDGVAPPPPLPPTVDTMIVPVAELEACTRRACGARGAGGGARELRQARARPVRDRDPRRADRRARRLGARPLTDRNRELLYLVVVGVLTGIGFASVYIARQAVVSWGSLGYALFFIALYLAAHVVARMTVPNADPYLLPMAGLLTAVGVTEIYRLGPSDAFKQGLWIVIGVALFAVTLFRLRRDYRVLEQVQVPLRRLGRSCCSSCRASLGSERP